MKPACPYAKKCPGCTLLQQPYVKQLAGKTAAVRERLARFAAGRAVDAVVAAAVPSPAPMGYRTSTKLCLSEDTFGQARIGLYERQSKTVVHIPDCPVQDAGVNRLLARLFADYARGRGPVPLVNHAKRGFQPGRLKFVTARLCPATGESGVVLSHTGADLALLREWIAGLGLRGVAVYASELRKEDEDRVLSHASVHLAGPETFRYQIGSIAFLLTPEAFFQANASLTPAFVQEVVNFPGRPAAAGQGVLLDLYGGFGAYALNAAAAFERLIVVDANVNAVDAARSTAKAAGVAHLTAHHATSEAYLAKVDPAVAAAVTHLIVNPPRSGLSPQVKAALGRKTFPRLEELVYVSCDPATLARDVGELTRAQGLRLERAVPFDMFPQTDHVEVVARLRPVGPAAGGAPKHPREEPPRRAAPRKASPTRPPAPKQRRSKPKVVR